MVRITIMIIAASLAAASPALAQVEDGDAAAIIRPIPYRPYESVKQYLGLTDFQVEQLMQIQKEKSDEWTERYKEIALKQREMYNLLNTGSQDVNRIGKLMLDIHTLQVQPPPSNAQYRQRALAVLAADQKAKLGLLEQALKLNSPAYQAVSLNLIDYYYESVPVPLPMPVPMPDILQGGPQVVPSGR